MIIALTGYGQVGKDSVGRLLVEQHGFTRVAFADKLKELALKIDPLVEDHEHAPDYAPPLSGVVRECGWEKAKSYPFVREYLQRLGVAAREVLGPNVWVDAVVNDIWPGWLAGNNYVITDVRFLNEAARVRLDFQPDVRVVRVQRPGYGPLNGHVSETELDQIRVDHTLVNDGTIEDLERKVRTLVIDGTTVNDPPVPCSAGGSMPKRWRMIR